MKTASGVGGHCLAKVAAQILLSGCFAASGNLFATDSVTVVSCGRKAFVRAEKDASYHVSISNATDKSLLGVRLEVRQMHQGGRCVSQTAMNVGNILTAGTARVDLPVETRLRPGTVCFEIIVSGKGDEGDFIDKFKLPAMIGPTLAERMPAIMWGGRLEGLADVGLTHLTNPEIGYFRKPQPDTEARAMAYLDACVTSGLRLIKYEVVTYPAGKNPEKYYRSTRDGKHSVHKSKNPRMSEEVSHPEMIEQARWQAARNAKLMGGHPGLGGLLAVSEARDHSFPSFNTEHRRYEAETGCNVPDEVYNRVLDIKVAEKRFPDGIVPEDDPIYRYYDWFWHGGDGWSAYCSAIADTYRKEIKRPFFSFWDPAVRCPPMWCAVKGVDFLNQWCYAVPDPMNVAGPLEEMFAMAAGTPGQQVMMMTQLICYRWSIAPENTTVSPVPRWFAKRPTAAFPTIPPDSLTEALWSMLAKPVKGVMFHGYGTIFETGSTSYCYTNPETTDRLRHLLNEVVEPLGPTLLRLGRETSPVAVMESATTALMGGHATFGWSAPAITFLQRARLDPRVVYEDTIRRDGLDGVKILYAPRCRFITPTIVRAIKEFQQNGGVLIGDVETVSALKPDILVPIASFSPPALDDTESFNASELAQVGDVNRRRKTWLAKLKMQQDAEKLRHELSARGFTPAADSSSPEIVVYGRKWHGVPYLFAINDKRTFGNYVGQWGCTMEKGLPFAGEVTISDGFEETQAVYELSRGGEVEFRRKGGRLSVSLSYTTNDGRLLAFLPRKIGKVVLEVPETAVRGGVLHTCVRILDVEGRPVRAVLPVEIRIYDAKGDELDGAGWTCAEDGVAKLDVPLNVDDPGNSYTIWCGDRASGFTALKTVSMTKEEGCK